MRRMLITAISLGVLAVPMYAQATLIDVEMSGASAPLNNSSLNLLLENLSIESSLLPEDVFQVALLNVWFNSATRT